MLKVNNLDKSGVVNESFRQIIIDSISSTTLATTVAKAAPFTPILGIPNKPKMKIAFKIIFNITATELIFATSFVFLPSFINAIKH